MKQSTPSRSTGFRVFPTSVALVLTELAFWLVLLLVWYFLQRVAPNIQLEHPHWWPLLILLPASLAVFIWSYTRNQRWARRLADESLWDQNLPRWKPRLQGWKYTLWRLAMAAALLGLLDIKVGARLREVKSEGVDIMMAVDVSNSMEAEDLGLSRLNLAKRTVERLLGKLDGDRVGLVVFAGDAYVQCPITTDYGAIKLFLDGVNTGLVPIQGTAVGRAMEVCQAGFDLESPASKLILVLTDGENHEDDAPAIARKMANQSIEVHTIGMGTAGGAPIPIYDRYGRPKGFKMDTDGNPIVTALDEATLIQIAEAGNGTFTRAGQGMVNLNPILDAIRTKDQAEIATLSYTDYDHYFSGFLAGAILLLLLESLIGSNLFVSTSKSFRR
ncbi:MAG: VWA domain-containing protein [Flavobacteriales bacterium]|nr:VWA domain-containing protein [Flavobacteriales bacterium]